MFIATENQWCFCVNELKICTQGTIFIYFLHTRYHFYLLLFNPNTTTIEIYKLQYGTNFHWIH